MKYIIDVRTAEEYRQGHIAGALNIPLTQIRTIINKIPDKNMPIFLYCKSGGRASDALNILKRMGYSNVSNMGGISGHKLVR